VVFRRCPFEAIALGRQRSVCKRPGDRGGTLAIEGQPHDARSWQSARSQCVGCDRIAVSAAGELEEREATDHLANRSANLMAGRST
jgi:hypothetical protein